MSSPSEVFTAIEPNLLRVAFVVARLFCCLVVVVCRDLGKRSFEVFSRSGVASFRRDDFVFARVPKFLFEVH